MRLHILALTLLTSASAALAQEPIPAGEEFIVNTLTAHSQLNNQVTVDGAGNFIVIWEGPIVGINGKDIFGQRFDASGQRLGGELVINGYTSLLQRRPSVAADAMGNFVVVWESYGQDGSGFGIRAQRLDSAGQHVGEEFQVNTVTAYSQEWPNVAMADDGRFVVVWQGGDYGMIPSPDGDRTSIQAQIFDASGSMVGSELKINSYTTGFQFDPSVIMDSQGGFIVSWTSEGQDGDRRSIQARRFDAFGDALSDDVQVNTYTTAHQWHSELAMDAQGQFVVTWNSFGVDGDSYGVNGQWFDADGQPVGEELLINTYTTGPQNRSHAAIDRQGNLIVVWASDDQDGDQRSVHGQRLEADGTRIGEEFQINTYTTDFQNFARIAISGDTALAVWRSGAQDGDSHGIVAQRYHLSPAIFSDGFESGDISSWSIGAGGSR
ncbi:MAG: hypothetical protein AAF560_31790 [Acidobacteriota bacterium]